MMTSRTDYLFVTVSDPLTVDGGIMPKRKSDPPVQTPFGTVEADRILRAEDIAFCAESVIQEQNVSNIALHDTTHIDRVININRWQTVCNGIRSIAQHAINSDFEFSTKLDLNSVPARTRSPGYYYQGASFDTSQLTSHASHFTAKLDRAPVMEVFHDLNLMRRFWAMYDTNVVRRDNEWGTAAYGEYKVETSASGGTLYAHQAVRFGKDFPELDGKYGSSTSIETDFIRHIISDWKYRDSVDRSGLVALIPVWASCVEYEDGSKTKDVHRYGFIAAKLSQGTMLETDYQSLQSGVQKFADTVGPAKYGQQLKVPQMRSEQSITVGWYFWMYVVAKMGSKTEFSQYMM